MTHFLIYLVYNCQSQTTSCFLSLLFQHIKGAPGWENIIYWLQLHTCIGTHEYTVQFVCTLPWNVTGSDNQTSLFWSQAIVCGFTDCYQISAWLAKMADQAEPCIIRRAELASSQILIQTSWLYAWKLRKESLRWD